MDWSLPVRDVMTREFVGVSESDATRATAELLLSEGARCAVVLRGTEPVGIVDRETLLRAFVEGRDDASVADVMVTDVPTIAPHAEVGAAVDLLATTPLLVVAEGDELVGLLTEGDVLTVPRGRPDQVDDAAAVEDVPETNVAEVTGGSGADADLVGDQGICEGCGAFARSLVPRDGQLLCADCRDV